MTEIQVQSLSVAAGEKSLLKGVSFSLKAGQLCVLLGPNGAGKTSLLRAMLGLSPAAAGSVQLDGQNLAAMAPESRARQIAYLPQNRPLAWPSPVFDVVALGRFAYGLSSSLGKQDRAAVDAAIDACDLTALKQRSCATLSGGELARVHCARALAAQTPLLIADEPVAALDPRHQFRIMDVLRDYVANGGGALVVLHDLNLAARYADRLLWLQQGQLIADGSPQETMTADRLAAVYDIQAYVSWPDKQAPEIGIQAAL